MICHHIGGRKDWADLDKQVQVDLGSIESPQCISKLEAIGDKGEVCDSAKNIKSEEQQKIFQLRSELEKTKKHVSKLERAQITLLHDNETLARGQVQCEMKMREVNLSNELLNGFTKSIKENKRDLELQLQTQYDRSALLVDKYRKLHENYNILKDRFQNIQNLNTCEELAKPKPPNMDFENLLLQKKNENSASTVLS